MILHVVLLKPPPDADPAAALALRDALLALRGRIPGLLDVHFGPNTSPEGLDHGFTLGFTVAFDSPASRDAYLPHPAHRAVVPLVRAASSEVLVFDLPLSLETGTGAGTPNSSPLAPPLA